ncbi:MAG: endolytic transglycosylase MltG [Elusimicrobiota bacterium]|jgi:UPF0755 protein|nr:endolytic transglycosylase MltG [Elusimicrobiota bacterium]
MVKKIKILIILIFAFFLTHIHLHAAVDNDEKIIVNIQKGEGVRKIAKKMKSKQLIASEFAFLFLTQITKSQDKLKAGVYSFSKKDGMLKILKRLKSGSTNLVRITIPEGNNIKQTAEIIAKALPIDTNKFIEIANLNNLEGYLMPETYFVDLSIDEQSLIEMMNNEFKKKFYAQLNDRLKETGEDLKNIIILASIVEKEAVKPEERAIIAAVFKNRIDKEIPLQSCATVLYAMGIVKPKLSIEDTKFASPFNTYIHHGLPPAPICSPGIESIKAALYPAQTDSLYFVSNGDGTHIFSSDFRKHVSNKRIASINRQNLKKINKK